MLDHALAVQGATEIHLLKALLEAHIASVYPPMHLPRILLKFGVILLLTTNIDAVSAEEAHGLFIEKDNAFTADAYATATEYASVETFPTVTHFSTTDGKQVAVISNLLMQIVDYDHVRPTAFREVLQESDLEPIEAAIQKLEGLSRRFPAARKFLTPIVGGLDREKEHFQKGQGKCNGQWYATRAIAIEERDRPLKMAAAESEKQEAMAKAAAERKAMEAKMRVQTAEQEIAAAKAQAQDFSSQVSDLLKRVLAEKIWTEHIDELKVIQPFPEDLVRQAGQADARWKDLQEQIKIPDARRICERAVPSLEAVLAWSRAAQSFASGEAPAGMDTLRELLSKYSAVSNPEISPIWDQMLNVFKTCQQQEEAAQLHLKKAEQFTALGGKDSQAIAEYQAAYSLFPSARVAAQIGKLRKESLGL